MSQNRLTGECLWGSHTDDVFPAVDAQESMEGALLKGQVSSNHMQPYSAWTEPKCIETSLIPTSVSQEAGITGVVADTSLGHLLKWGTVLFVFPATIPRVQFP